MKKTESSPTSQLSGGNSIENCLPDGFRFAGVAAGIKPSGKPDVSLIVAEKPTVVAGVYTQNQIVAAPVVLCRQRTPGDRIRAVITNSGNANACTGEDGLQDAQEMCRLVASRIGCEAEQVLVMSTGVIGRRLPMDSVRDGIEQAYQALAGDVPGFFAAADAIRTTDIERKVAGSVFTEAGQTIRITAMAKGAGMIAPNMATMLAVVMTDATLRPDDAQRLLGEAANLSFNRVSVDQHTSTNDTLLLMASGQGEALSGESLAALAHRLNEIAIDLAKQLVRDGEGAVHIMRIHVHGAADDEAANRIAKTIGDSPLVKTAITGGDPNWGRIVSAAGYADAKIQPERTSLRVCNELIYENGTPKAFDASLLSGRMKSEVEVALDLQVGDGPGKATRWASDLTTHYVTFNSQYTT